MVKRLDLNDCLCNRDPDGCKSFIDIEDDVDKTPNDNIFIEIMFNNGQTLTAVINKNSLTSLTDHLKSIEVGGSGGFLTLFYTNNENQKQIAGCVNLLLINGFVILN